MTYKQCQKKGKVGGKEANIFSAAGTEIFWHFWTCLFYCEPNKLVSNLQQHLDSISRLVWNYSGGSLNFYFLLIFAISGYDVEPVWRISHNLSQVSNVCTAGWWKLAPDGTELLFTEQRFCQDIDVIFDILRRFCSGLPLNVLSPGKAISPSARAIITAVFILFLFVLRGLSNITSVSGLHRGFGMLWNQPTRPRHRAKTFLTVLGN